jgi:hypothetical protein
MHTRVHRCRHHLGTSKPHLSELHERRNEEPTDENRLEVDLCHVVLAEVRIEVVQRGGKPRDVTPLRVPPSARMVELRRATEGRTPYDSPAMWNGFAPNSEKPLERIAINVAMSCAAAAVVYCSALRYRPRRMGKAVEERTTVSPYSA